MHYSLILVCCTALLMAGCKKTVRDEKYIADMPKVRIHIICDKWLTGKLEPWMIEFGPHDATMVLTSSSNLFYPRYNVFVLDTAGTTSMKYMFPEVPLFEMDSLNQVIEAIGITDKNYKHYNFRLNKRLKGDPVYKITSTVTGQYSTATAEKEYAIVTLSTNERIEDAVAAANAFFSDSLFSKKRYLYKG